MESIKKLIIVPVNGINQKSRCLLMKSKNKFKFVPVNGFNQNVNICAC